MALKDALIADAKHHEKFNQPTKETNMKNYSYANPHTYEDPHAPLGEWINGNFIKARLSQELWAIEEALVDGECVTGGALMTMIINLDDKNIFCVCQGNGRIFLWNVMNFGLLPNKRVELLLKTKE